MEILCIFRTPNGKSNSNIFGTFANSLFDLPEKVEAVIVIVVGNGLAELAFVALPRRNSGPLRLSALPFIVDVKVENDLLSPPFPKCAKVLTENVYDAADSRDDRELQNCPDIGVPQLLVGGVRVRSGAKLRSVVNVLKKLEYLYVGGALVGLPYSFALIVGLTLIK